MKREYRISERGFSQWLIILILMIGIGVGVWVAQIRTNLTPQAAPQQESHAQTSMELKLIDPLISTSTPFRIQILLHSEIDSVRLVSSQLKYNPQNLDLIKIETPQSSTSATTDATTSSTPVLPKASHWLETLFDNKEGKASLTAQFEQSGLITSQKDTSPFLFATVVFKPKTVGETEVSIDNSSVMLRSADNVNILTKKQGIKLSVTEASASANQKQN